MPTDSSDKSAEQSSEKTLQQVLTDFNSAWEYCSGSWHQRWDTNYALYHNNRVKRGYVGIADTFVPMAFSTVETLVSALFGTKPKWNYLPPFEKADQNTDYLNALVDSYWEKGQWSIKVENTGRTGLMIGTGVDYWCWDNDRPDMINVPTRDYFRDPKAQSGVEPSYQGRRYLDTLDNLKTYEIVDPETGEMRKKFKNLDKVVLGGSAGDPTDKEEKDMWYGSTVTNPAEKQVEVIEYWTNDKVVSVANRAVVIQDEENPFKAKARANGAQFPKGLMPFNWFRDYVDPSLFYAKGEIDFIADQQEMLNDLTNQNIDSITFTLNQMYTLDPTFAHMLSEVENIPGAVYPFPKDALNPIRQGVTPPDAFTERQNIKNEIRETTASNEVVRGVGSQKGSDPTATEINAQIMGAGQRIGLKVMQIENEYFQRMATIVFELIKLYITKPVPVRISGKDGTTWEVFDPKEYAVGEYEPRVQLDISMQEKKREQAQQSKELLASFLGDPEVNQQELKKLVLQRGFDLEPDEVELLMQPMPATDPMAMGMPPEAMAPPAPPNPISGLFGGQGMQPTPQTGAPIL